MQKKFYITLLFIGILSPGFGQGNLLQRRISLSMTGTLKEIIERISSENNINFTYSDNLLPPLSARRTVAFQNEMLQTVLQDLFRTNGIEFASIGGGIALKYEVAKEGFRITGTVQDDNGLTLPGVTVRVVGTTVGSETNKEGRFAIRMPPGRNALRFTFVGMETQEISFDADKEITVTLKDEIKTLNEVVVTGYNVEKNRTELVGSVAQINSANLQVDRPIESFERLLNGKIAGVQITYDAGGEAGLPASVRIRGQGTLPATGQFARTSSSEPLYILDGVPMYDIQEAQFNTASAREQRLNPLASLNPADIETITVLKDASASAIYGANAANGVILITTKRGSKEGLKIDFGYTTGVSNAINTVKLLNTDQYVELLTETLRNSGVPEAEIPNRVGSTEIYTQWEKINLQQAGFTSANMSISGGNSRIRVRNSFNYQKQETISRGNDHQRFSGRSNVDATLSDKVSMNYSMVYAHTRKNSLSGFDSRNFPPNVSPYNPDGTFNESGFFEDRPNPLSVLAQNDNNHKGNAINASLRLNYAPVDNIRLTAFFGIDSYQNRHFLYESGRNATGRNANGRLSIVDRANFKWISNAQARWGTTFGHHKVSTMVGGEIQEQITDLIRGNASNFPFDRLRTLQSAINAQSASSMEEIATVSSFGELSYDYKSKYFLSINTRADASSIFGGDVRRARFGSVGASWNASEEAFVRSLTFLDLLKFRASYGTTGNSKIGSYAARGLYRIETQYYYDGQGGAIPITAENLGLTWEKNFKLNTGMDMTLFKRYQVTLEYYQNDIKDAISIIPVPYESGFVSADVNAADMRNSGWEITLGTELMAKGKFRWSSDFNAATNRNIITQIKLDQNRISETTGIGYVVGQDVRTIYGVNYAGVDPATGKPIFYLPNGGITDNYTLARNPQDRVPIGTRNPKLFGGWTNSLSYGNFTFTLFSTYTTGSNILVSNFYETDGRQLSFLNQSVNQLDRWTTPGQITSVPRLHLSNYAYTNLSRYIYDNSHIKIENIMVNYRVPVSFLSRYRIHSCSAFAQMNNVHYFYFEKTPKGRNGIAEYRYQFPEGRTITLGLNISL
jgi:TonB-dependent starch-binding outer membrane protein SusC